jgi:hypothetical protein
VSTPPSDVPGPPRPPDQRQGDLATHWAEQHPSASIEEAYRAGYQDAIQAFRRAESERAAVPAFSAATKTTRTMVAALSLFRDQVLIGATEEITSGEWCSVEEVNQLIAHLTATEAARA